ncbi:MAG: right-handed parallel beta-helix repeat-containing protein [Stigonema ocellatum SAG 48.90 = DSM 106950]|nr:right-handed parallel beta-helix repeat-containing protein [Stigonema ocellatum SAG 48.90 = DSM 106950]
MDLSIPGSTNAPLSTAAVFADNVQDLLGTGTLQVHPTGIIVVNSIDDTVNSRPSVTTLRDAINKANADSGEDLIVFERSLFSTAQTITLNLGELDITHDVDIVAPRDTLTGGDLVTVSGNNASRVFGIGTPATVSLDGLIVADGKVTGGNGGGILNSGILTLDNSIVRNNSALSDSNFSSGYGGGISNDGNLTLSNSTISGNTSRFGGGIYNFTGTVSVNNSNISGNTLVSVGGGGGIYNSAGKVSVNNSTISGNNTDFGLGGGIYNGMYNGTGTVSVNNSTISGNTSLAGGGIYNGSSATLTLVFSTVTQNQAANGGGLFNGTASSSQTPGTLNVRNTIIASNLNTKNGVNPDVSGTFTSFGYNLIGDSTGSTGFDATGDIVGTSDNPIDPRLDTLNSNGGPTQTIALLPDSPAIGAADPTILDTDPTTDQRGLPRRAALGSADIGAYELS